MYKILFQRCLDWIFPRQCLLCSTEILSNHFCDSCLDQLPWVEDQCYQCACALIYPLEAVYCTSCREQPPYFDRVCCLWNYIDPVQSMIAKLKYTGALYYGPAFGSLLAYNIQKKWYTETPYPDWVIYVPLTDKKLRKRQFNQAFEIAKPLVKHLNLKMDGTLCTKIKETPSQVNLTKSERQKNLLKCFQINSSVVGRHIAIVDDVMTTGSTVNAISQLLKVAGALQVDVWCVARA